MLYRIDTVVWVYPVQKLVQEPLKPIQFSTITYLSSKPAADRLVWVMSFPEEHSHQLITD